MIGLIVARSKNNVIGKNGNIPWKIKGEQKQFRELTTGNVVIMGRKSYEEIGHPLPNRMNIVVSTTTEYQGDNLVSVKSLEDALLLAKGRDVYISGGYGLFKEALQIVDKMYITEVDLNIEDGDTFFPEFDINDFEVLIGETLGEEDGLNYYTYRTQRLNYYAVKALKARVYLWADNKAEAYREAKAVTAVQEQWFPWTERREIMDNTRNPDRIFSSELLFAAYYNAREEIFTNYFSPTLEPAQVYSPKKHIDDLFTWDLLDWRNRPIWLEGTTRDYRCFHKYEDVSSTEVWTKLIPLIRMTEMYYIIAETATDETEALDALNTVLFNRGVKELEDKTQLAGMLRDEYRREFFGEGQLFFYYKRLNVKVLHSYSENADLDMDAAKYVVPLPLSETDFR